MKSKLEKYSAVIGCLCLVLILTAVPLLASWVTGTPLSNEVDETVDVKLTCVYVGSTYRNGSVNVAFNSEMGNRYTTVSKAGVYAEGDVITAHPIHMTRDQVSPNLITDQNYILYFQYDIHA